MKVWVTSDEMYPVQTESVFCDPEFDAEIELTEEEYAAWKKAQKDFFEWNDKIGALQDAVVRKNNNERFRYLGIHSESISKETKEIAEKVEEMMSNPTVQYLKQSWFGDKK